MYLAKLVPHFVDFGYWISLKLDKILRLMTQVFLGTLCSYQIAYDKREEVKIVLLPLESFLCT